MKLKRLLDKVAGFDMNGGNETLQKKSASPRYAPDYFQIV